VDVDQAATLDRAQTRRRGSALTIVTWSAAVHTVLQAADTLQRDGIDASVIDLGSLWPWDRDTVFADCARTRRLLVVHEAVQAGGFGAEVAASAAEATGCRVARLGAPRVPVGYAATLEAQSRIAVQAVVQAARTLCAVHAGSA
jgi:acetoin:2,6-dichlorophenolindophenol oxidoreductase subunit beta